MKENRKALRKTAEENTKRREEASMIGNDPFKMRKF